MRQLYIIPIIHSRHDLGTLELPIHEMKSQLLSTSTLEHNQKVLDLFWGELKSGIESWGVDYSNALVFQDALPFTGHPEKIIEHRIVAEMASKGSANHQLVKWLVDQGAELIGTESAELLIKEYEAVKKSLAEGIYQEISAEGDSGINDAATSLLAARDQFIARRITESLKDGQVGILFVGLQHRVQNYLPDDLTVTYPFGKAKDCYSPKIYEPVPKEITYSQST